MGFITMKPIHRLGKKNDFSICMNNSDPRFFKDALAAMEESRRVVYSRRLLVKSNPEISCSRNMLQHKLHYPPFSHPLHHMIQIQQRTRGLGDRTPTITQWSSIRRVRDHGTAEPIWSPTVIRVAPNCFATSCVVPLPSLGPTIRANRIGINGICP